MSLEDEALKLEELRRRAAGQNEPEADPSGARREPARRDAWGWIAWLLLVVVITAPLSAGLRWVADNVGLEVPLAFAMTVGLLYLVRTRDEVRRLRDRVEAIESV